MNNKDSYRVVDRFYVPEWLTEQIQVANFNLVDHMKWLLKQDSRFNEVFNIERKEIEQLQLNQPSLRNLLRAPFLMVEPTLQTVEDWRCFVDNTATTIAVDALRRKTPPLDSLTAYAVNHQNSTFISLVTHTLNQDYWI